MISNLTISGGGSTVHFGLVEDSKVTRSASAVGGGGWQVTDRPRGRTATEWVDVGHYQLQMALIMDATGGSHGPTSLEGLIKVIEGWEAPVHGSNPPLPPRLTVHGPVPHNELRWVVYQLSWGVAHRSNAGWRYYQELSLTLWEYSPPGLSVANAQSPAAQAAAGSTKAVTIYTVRAGDTLSTIAARQLGNASLWPSIAKLNGIRDPRSIHVGQRLKMPPKPNS